MESSQCYYDLNPIRSKKDINGKNPSLYLITGNRASGKSHAIVEHSLSFLRKKRYRKIGVLCRNKYELADIGERFFSVSNWMHHKKYHTGKVSEMGYAPIYYDGCHVGYGISLRASDNIKSSSGLFQEVDACFWDEFQREDNNYLPKEIINFKAVVSSISRGEGKQARYVPFYLVSNTISLLSPILADLEIEKRLHSNTKFVRGDKFVFEQNINLSALNAQKDISSLGRENYLGDSVVKYLNDNTTSIKTLRGANLYCETFVYNNNSYSIRYYIKEKLFYCSKSVDFNCKRVYTKDSESVDGYIIIPDHINRYRVFFNNGKFRFSDLESKSALIKYISYG